MIISLRLVQRERMISEDGWIHLSETRYIISSTGRCAVYDEDKQKYRILSGVESPNHLRYYKIKTKDGLYRLYEGMILELFTKPHEPCFYLEGPDEKEKHKRPKKDSYSMASMLSEEDKSKIISRFINGERVRNLYEEYHMQHSELISFLIKELSEEVYNQLIKDNRREALNKARKYRYKKPEDGDLQKFFT